MGCPTPPLCSALLLCEEQVWHCRAGQEQRASQLLLEARLPHTSGQALPWGHRSMFQSTYLIDAGVWDVVLLQRESQNCTLLLAPRVPSVPEPEIQFNTLSDAAGCSPSSALLCPWHCPSCTHATFCTAPQTQPAHITEQRDAPVWTQSWIRDLHAPLSYLCNSISALLLDNS